MKKRHKVASSKPEFRGEASMLITGSGEPYGRRKIGLALSSGVARGWAHVGALRALTRLGINFDILTGCSAGALVGACYLARQLDELETWALALNKRKIYRVPRSAFGARRTD